MTRAFRNLILILLAAVIWPTRSTAAESDTFRHALIMGVAVYQDEEIPPLFGVPNDMDSAREIATAMGIPAANITELFNEQATKANIIAELRKLSQRKTDGGRILIYFSGHGVRVGGKAAPEAVSRVYSPGTGKSSSIASLRNLRDHSVLRPTNSSSCLTPATPEVSQASRATHGRLALKHCLQNSSCERTLPEPLAASPPMSEREASSAPLRTAWTRSLRPSFTSCRLAPTK